ncbi:hypothetical protein DSCO28_31960 [Desulfosarcina ovata subsp. sediminis]|uniref:Uncharacterized protein n=1 Tax=Desulfosarcina ovata subsp. sediminis TaxID=885957 RepID=A0A5K7ZR22_9BACT|nr:hypothetical protein DSCO28_31960 [Desulfosarcina ovata subsp. sediminis]
MPDGLLVHELFGHADGVLGAAFSPDDALVITVGSDHTRVWDVHTGQQVGDFVGSEAYSLFILHDCSALVTVSDFGPPFSTLFEDDRAYQFAKARGIFQREFFRIDVHHLSDRVMSSV